MGKKLTLEEFIDKAKEIHGDRYDYSKVVYKNRATKVIIVCPEHGEFLQRPDSHLQKCGCPVCAHAQRAKTCFERYGMERPMLSEENREKSKQALRDKYNVSSPSQIPAVKEKIKQTFIERYGVSNPMQDADIKNKAKQTNLERYGAACSMQNEDVKVRHRESVKAHYGVENVMQSPEVKNKAQQTFIERYGVSNPRQNPEISKKIENTCLEKYGVPHVVMSDEVRAKSVEAFVKKYGVKNPMQNDVVKAKMKQTCFERYGASNPMQSETVQQTYRETMKERYGCEYVLQNEGFMNKCLQSKKANNSFNTSKPEEELYLCLCDVFGENDVIRQYSSHKYPYLCDFYIKSRDLYIELNASWTHGGHWYDVRKDGETLLDWSDLAVNSDYYKNAVAVWAGRDVVKKGAAESNNLNYVVFWDNDLRDAELWFAMGCPDGQDWKREYSWLPDRKITGIGRPDKLTGTSSNLSIIAKSYQCDVFYEREIELWNANPEYKGLPLQVWLYHNRLRYVNKLPEQLSDSEILRGFTISGIRKGYTAFNASLMDKAVKQYNIKSVYDPCAGWGERLLYCYYNNIEYLGVDINEKLEFGYKSMIEDFDIRNQSVIFADSAEYQPQGDFDAVITCPPYGSIEKYSNKGAENSSESEFLDWWQRVISNCRNVDYFCFQINQKWHDKMLQIILEYGFEFLEEFKFDKNQSSHFTRKNGINIKKEFETMIITGKKGLV